MSDATNGEGSPAARLQAWLAARPDANKDLATSQFRTAEYRTSMLALRVVHGLPEPVVPPAPAVPLKDDGVDDLVWARKHPDRRFRVRPWRGEDGAPRIRPGHCITVFDVVTKHGAWGVPIDAMHSVGMPAKIEDSDLYGELFLLTHAASNGFRNKRPGFTG